MRFLLIQRTGFSTCSLEGPRTQPGFDPSTTARATMRDVSSHEGEFEAARRRIPQHISALGPPFDLLMKMAQ